MKKTIAGDIRRIRKNILKVGENGSVRADFGDLHKAFDEIEAKEKDYQKLIKELADALGSKTLHCKDYEKKWCPHCLVRTEGCETYSLCNLIAKAREVVAS